MALGLHATGERGPGKASARGGKQKPGAIRAGRIRLNSVSLNHFFLCLVLEVALFHSGDHRAQLLGRLEHRDRAR